MTQKPKLGYIDLHYSSRSGNIRIAFDCQFPIRRADVKRVTGKKMEVYRKEAELYWAAALDLLYCFAKDDKVEPLLLGKTQCEHWLSENSSEIVVWRNIQPRMQYIDGWDEIGYYIPFETTFDDERSFSNGCLDFYFSLFEQGGAKASRIASTRRRLQKLKSRLELGVGRIASIYLEDEVVNLALLDPVWSEIVSPDGSTGFEFLGMMLDQHEIVTSVADNKTHDNIILLVKRMDDALLREDYASVIHASASIFETMAKDIVGIPSVQDQTLKSFFDRYKHDSRLPLAILDYMLQVYDSRSTTPLAGHGSTQNPNINRVKAVTMCEVTKAIVRAEYRLHRTPGITSP